MSWLSIDFSNPNISETNADIQKLPSEIRKDFEIIIENFRKGKPEAFHTSGTNGISKTFVFSQEQIKSSVQQTLDFFKLHPGMSITSPLSLEFVAGKMNLYRCLYGRLRLNFIPPGSFKNQLESIPFSNLITLVPNQFYELIKVNPLLKNMEQILLGGGPIQERLNISNGISASIFHGFGMTETLTHFAISELHPIATRDYKTIGQFQIEINDEQLVVSHPVILPNGLQTEEIVDQTENGFIWKGRSNNMIKSGGLKFFPEILEQKITSQIDVPYIIVGLPHPKLGEAITLIVEGKFDKSIDFSAFLGKYETPKSIIRIISFPRTTSGKIKRKEVKKQFATHYENLD